MSDQAALRNIFQVLCKCIADVFDSKHLRRRSFFLQYTIYGVAGSPKTNSKATPVIILGLPFCTFPLKSASSAKSPRTPSTELVTVFCCENSAGALLQKSLSPFWSLHIGPTRSLLPKISYVSPSATSSDGLFDQASPPFSIVHCL